MNKILFAFLGLSLILGGESSQQCDATIYDRKKYKGYYFNIAPLSHYEGKSDTQAAIGSTGCTVYVNPCSTTTVYSNPKNTVVVRDASYSFSGYGDPTSQNISALGL